MKEGNKELRQALHSALIRDEVRLGVTPESLLDVAAVTLRKQLAADSAKRALFGVVCEFDTAICHLVTDAANLRYNDTARNALVVALDEVVRALACYLES